MCETTQSTASINYRAPRRLLSWRRHLGDTLFSNLTLVFALLVVGILLGMIVILNIDALPALHKFGIAFFGGSSWDPVKEEFGALPAI